MLLVSLKLRISKALSTPSSSSMIKLSSQKLFIKKRRPFVKQIFWHSSHLDNLDHQDITLPANILKIHEPGPTMDITDYSTDTSSSFDMSFQILPSALKDFSKSSLHLVSDRNLYARGRSPETKGRKSLVEGRIFFSFLPNS